MALFSWSEGITRDVRRWVMAGTLLAVSAACPAQTLRVPVSAFAQTQTSESAQTVQEPTNASDAQAADALKQWIGLPVEAIRFEGVSGPRLEPLPSQLALQAGMLLDADKLRQSLRRLFSTGLYQGIEVQGIRGEKGVTIIFAGSPILFVGRVDVAGVKSQRLATLLERATKLDAGSPYSEEKAKQADELLVQTLQENGFYQTHVTHQSEVDPPNAQINLTFNVAEGSQVRVGNVTVEGDSGLPLSTFRKKGKLKEGSKVDRDTFSRALANLRKHYQKKDRLEADISVESKEYRPPQNTLDLGFKANQGPIVQVEVKGAKISSRKMKQLVPVYEEGAVDEDLLNEGNRNLRDYFQKHGYFDVRVTHQQDTNQAGRALVTFNVVTGPIHRVDSIDITGNKYFDKETLQEHLSVQRANVIERHGLFSQSLVNADVANISALYQNNGYTNVKVTPVVTDTDSTSHNSKATAHLTVKYQIDEGEQQKIGTFKILGAEKLTASELLPTMNSEAGQPYSPTNLAADRDSLVAYYLSHGFDHVQVEVNQKPEAANADRVDVAMKVTEGEQVFVNKVLISGLHHTLPAIVNRRLQLHDGDALNESALLDTQRSLYDLSLFNEVNTAVQNPTGDELRKNVLLQLREARRWDVTYGFGFEAQTGTPQHNCSSSQVPPTTSPVPPEKTTQCSPGGSFGVSPRVLFDVTRSNLRGREQSISIRTSYGTLEKRATFILLTPRLFNHPTFDLSLSGGYINSQDVTTYAASRLEGTIRLTEHVNGSGLWINRGTTFIYYFAYRRVQVDANSIQVAPEQVPLYSQPVRVGGPGFVWTRDTRDAPLDAHRGSYWNLQEFIADQVFGSEANFNRLDLTNSTFHAYGKQKKWVLARSTRFGFERSFGDPSYEVIPLPERLYAGGASSHRGFSINAAGPRDSQTGYPIGGAGAFVNSTELRMPPSNLPYVGNNLSFVLFHDMGNVFNKSSDIWPSFIRIRQPDQGNCKLLPPPPLPHADGTPSPLHPWVQPPCSFNYFSHAIGLGLRYHTPIGPIRVDLSYNLNPPIFPVFYDYNINANVRRTEQAAHFNFFFSIGQTF